MSVFEIIAAAFLGITVFALDVAFMYATFTFWQERQRFASIVFCMTAVGLTVAYMVTVINKVFG